MMESPFCTFPETNRQTKRNVKRGRLRRSPVPCNRGDYRAECLLHSACSVKPALRKQADFNVPARIASR